VSSSLKLDLNDQLYFYTLENESINIFETYKIDGSQKSTVFEFGKFMPQSRKLEFNKDSFWKRRADLMVNLFKYKIDTLKRQLSVDIMLVTLTICQCLSLCLNLKSQFILILQDWKHNLTVKLQLKLFSKNCL